MKKSEIKIRQYLSNSKNEAFTQNSEQKSTLLRPTFCDTKPITYVSKISEKKNGNDVRLNNFGPFQSGFFDEDGHVVFPGQFITSFFNVPFGQIKLQSRPSNEPKPINNVKLDPTSLFLNNLPTEKEDNFKEKKIENKNFNYNPPKLGNKDYIFNYFNKNYNLKKNDWTPEKNINLNLNMNMNMETTINNNSNINNSGTKFFTNHNYGYKCSCSKTQCNRKYCECFNSGNYCIDCNCKNCNNKPPVNSYTNKHPTDDSAKNKKEKIICTCTKSGCNKNYCECYKNAQKCTPLCRCISCENNDQITNKRNNNCIYECCPANSIYIIKNALIIEKINGKKSKEEQIKNNFDFCVSQLSRNENFIAIGKKRKKEETKNNEENYDKKKKNGKDLDENDLFNDSLFDKNGKMILKYINLISRE